MNPMKLRKILPVTVLMILLVLLVSSLSAGAAGTGNSYYVSVPRNSVDAAAGLDLNPAVAFDYGSYHWLVLDEQDYATLAASGVSHTLAPEGGNVQITGYKFDPLVDGEPAVPAGMSAPNNSTGFYLVQFYGPTNDNWLAGLEANGLQVLQYYPHYTYLVWGTANQAAAAEAGANVRWTGAVHPAYKMNSDLAKREGLVKNVDVFFYNDGNVEGTLDAIAALGGNVLNAFPAQPDRVFYSAIVELDAAAFDSLAKLDTVLWFGHISPEPILDDEMSSQIVAGNYTGGVPFVGYFNHLNDLGYDGSGVIWAVVDTGVDYDHPDLGPRIVGGHEFPGACNTGNPGEDCSNGGHGTHVAGIIGGDATAGFADGDGFLYGLGIAPGYSIFAMNSLSAPSWPPAGGWQEHSRVAVLGGAIGGNNSWTTGEGTNHGYQASERTHDIMVLDGNFDTANVAEPFIEVFSAGNSGFSGLTAPKEGKNLVVTASSRNFRVGDIDTISGFSSRGPAVDGRWVPTIAGPGEQIASTRNDTGGVCATPIGGTNNLYAFCSGTSMASPQAAGSITLITEWWRDTHGGNDPSSAMAKAFLVNGAVDMGAADIPNIHEGWGRVNTTNVISPSVPVEYYDLPVVFGDSGDSWTLNAGVADPSQPVKITLAWADAPGAVGANPALVNNLDLTATVGGTTYLGNVFSGGWSNTGGSADTINNLENVYVQNPSGSIQITVDAVNIAGDAILYNADTTDQSFALICRNCALFPDFGLTASPNPVNVCAPDDAVYTVDVSSILGFNDPVTLSTLGEPAGTTTGFSTNPVIPPGQSTLTISGTGNAAAGSYDVDIIGMAPTSTHTTTVGLNLFDGAPGAPTLTSPPDGATNVSTQPTFMWQAVAQADTYDIEIATDPSFNNIVDAATVSGTSYTPGIVLDTSTTYYWHVSASNTCGDGNFSATWSFTTESAPGDCGPGSIPNQVFFDDLESGAAGWTTGGTNPTWALGAGVSPGGPISGANVYHADDVAIISDQYLVSPAIDLPTGESPVTLHFWNYQEIEDGGAGCYDGGVLEISNNGGGTWTRLEAELLTDPYDGEVDGGFGNPLAGENAWCGDPQDWLNSIVDVDAWAGDTVQFRWRLATDSLVSHPGWDIDDIEVQSCSQGPTPTATSPAPTNTPIPPTSTATSVPPTATSVGATATSTAPATGVEMSTFDGNTNTNWLLLLIPLAIGVALLAYLKHMGQLKQD